MKMRMKRVEMKRTTDLTVRTQLIAGFGCVLFALVVLAAIAVLQVQDVRRRLDDIIDVNGVKERYAINFRGSVHDRSIALRDVTLVSAGELPTVIDHVHKLADDYERSAKPMDAIFSDRADITPIERQIYQHINAARDQTLPLINKVIQDQTEGNSDVAKEILLRDARPAFIEWLASINAMIDFQQSLSEQEGAQARQISKHFRVLMGVLTALACALSAAVAWFVVRNIGLVLGADPREMIAFADAIRQGDLSGQVILREGDTSSVMATVARMRDTLAVIVQQVRQGAHGVAEASLQIAQGNGDLGERTGRQATALEQATSALTEFDASVAANATNANHADEVAKRASVTAGEGGQAVNRVVDTMQEISASSNRISEIIAVIDSIAFQTNILALNAAVEAARAGSQGRGFAVVASEVRTLAQRSADAAKEIKLLITESSDRVDAGANLVDVAGTTIAEVVTSSGNVTAIMSEINEACRAQTLQVGEVRDMIEHLEQGTQQNVALVEQSGAAAKALRDQADSLLEAVGVFKLA